MLKYSKKLFSLKILEKISFTKNFYHAVENRLIEKGKYLRLDILPGEGCGGFTYEFQATDEKLNSEYLKLVKNGKIYFAVNQDCIQFLDGSFIDFEEDVHKTSFVVKENPNAELTCSCKKSFSPKLNL